MELKPRQRLRRPMEVPLRRPKRMTVCVSMGFASKNRSRCATCSVQYVTSRCQLVSVVAAHTYVSSLRHQSTTYYYRFSTYCCYSYELLMY